MTTKQKIEDMNMYSRMLAEEALRRGITVKIIDAPDNLYKLTHNGKSHVCRESLTDRSSAIDVSRVRDKNLAYKMFKKAGFPLPDQIIADDENTNLAFLKKHKSIVVKPALGERGWGVSADIRSQKDLQKAIESAKPYGSKIILEEFIHGIDLRFIVIDFIAHAAAVRTKPSITGDGTSSIKQLADTQNQALIAQGKPQFQIPLDEEYERILSLSGLKETDIPEKGKIIELRKNANVHMGGVKYDVTDTVHPALMQAAQNIAKCTNLRVIGVDLMVKDYTKPDYVIIEAGERPSLYNHDKQKVIAKFIDSLFPETRQEPTKSNTDGHT